MEMVYQALEGLGWITIFGFIVIAALVVESGKQNRRREDDVDVGSDRFDADSLSGPTDVDFNAVGSLRVEPKGVESNSDPGVVL